MIKHLLGQGLLVKSCNTELYRSAHNIPPPPPPPFPPVKVIRRGKHVGYETLDGELIPVSPSSNGVPIQWIVLFVFVFLLGVATGYFVL